LYAVQTNMSTDQASPRAKAKANLQLAARILELAARSLASALKILINRAIRGSRPGAERTVSAISPFGDVDVAGPVGPSSRASAF
jgi:hypothetical protein